jgi:antitoxin component of MazEF toxin-antitoxin module
MRSKISKVGGSLGIIIPHGVAQLMEVRAGEPIDLRLDQDQRGLTIRMIGPGDVAGPGGRGEEAATASG